MRTRQARGGDWRRLVRGLFAWASLTPSSHPARGLLVMRMISRLLLSLVLACSLIACTSPQKKKEKEETAKAKLAAEDAEEKGSDPNFLAFIGRLRRQRPPSVTSIRSPR